MQMEIDMRLFPFDTQRLNIVLGRLVLANGPYGAVAFGEFSEVFGGFAKQRSRTSCSPGSRPRNLLQVTGSGC